MKEAKVKNLKIVDDLFSAEAAQARSKECLRVDVIAKSRFSKRTGITSFVATYPRIIHAELMTHRLFSRNAASSRAMPISAMIERVRTGTFVPWHWLSNQKGMQGGIPLPEENMRRCRDRWIADAERAMESAAFYEAEGLLKGLANRCMETYSFMQTLITVRTEALPHFLNLRNDPDAEDHFGDLAGIIENAVESFSEKWCEWHLPFITDEEQDESTGRTFWELAAVSSVRSRRVSYFGMPFVDETGELVYPKAPPAWEHDLGQSKEMMEAAVIHASPFEHPCASLSSIRVKTSTDVDIGKAVAAGNLALPGETVVDFVQYRKTLENEFMRTRKRRARRTS